MEKPDVNQQERLCGPLIDLMDDLSNAFARLAEEVNFLADKIEKVALFEPKEEKE